VSTAPTERSSAPADRIAPASRIVAARPTLFVIGHPDRGDDGAAEAALAHVARTALESVDVVRAMDLDVEALMSVGPIVVADAIRGPQPGTVVVWTLAEVAELPAAPTASTHGLPLPAVLKLAAALGGHPLDGRFVGIAGARFAIGSPLSAPVRAALPRAAAAIETALLEVCASCA
jgi:hydrogenase maturation protease